MGAGKKTKGRASRRQRKQATPVDSGTARSAGDLPGKPPAGRVVCYPAPVPPGFSPRGCKGRSPLHEITLILPLPAGKGVGGMGAEKKTKSRVGRQQRKQATPTAPARPAPGERTISNAEVPLPRSPLSLAAGTARREPLSFGFAANHGFNPRECTGRSPPLPPSPIKTARNPRPQSGRGRSRPARSGSSGNADYISIPMFLFSASSSEQRQQRQRSAEPQRHLRR